jgi:S-adenosylmethionine:tRNA ribosyltransferase-isomerase
VSVARLAFELPAELAATEPPEARGIARDAVRLMVARRGSGEIAHTTFERIADHLAPGDLVVVNSSATIPAAFDATAPSGERIVIHLSTPLDDGTWVLEPRRLVEGASTRWSGPLEPGRLQLEDGAHVELVRHQDGSSRLWIARLGLPEGTFAWLARHGRPIRYSYVPRAWPLADYQNVYATEPGSAEMPSAGRPFSVAVIADLVARGVGITPVTLHTGVASLEAGEEPYPERVSVPAWTASRVNAAKMTGGRVVAVGTTVVRALESAADERGHVTELDGWTDLVIGPDRPTRVVDGIITGWHEPETSHLQMLEEIAGPSLLADSYEAALERRYLFHEFGDSHLVLP